MEVYRTFLSHFAGKKKSEKPCTASSCTTQLRYTLQNGPRDTRTVHFLLNRLCPVCLLIWMTTARVFEMFKNLIRMHAKRKFIDEPPTSDMLS